MTPPPATTLVEIESHEGTSYLLLPEEHPLVETTRVFILWDHTMREGYAAIPQHLAILVLLPTHNLSTSSGHPAAFGKLNILTFGLSNQAWGRVVDTLDQAGAFITGSAMTRAIFHKRLASLPTTDQFIIRPADIEAGDPLSGPQQTTGGRGRGRGGRGTPEPTAQDTTGGEEALRFLASCPITSLISARGPPFQLICILAGTLGPCHTNRHRRDEQSRVRIVAKILATNIGTFLGVGTACEDHAVLAAGLCPFLAATALPTALLDNNTSAMTMTVELCDGIRRGPARAHARGPPCTPPPLS